MLKNLKYFPEYLVSTDGTVYSDKRKTRQPLRPRNINGYDTVILMVNGEQHVQYIHKLIAQTFIHNDDPENKTQVIHKDGDKRNNDVSNLEWTRKGEGVRRYFESHDVRRNKFDDVHHIPGTVLDGTSSYKIEPKIVQEPLSDKELTVRINNLSKKVINIKGRYTRKIMKMDIQFQKAVNQLKTRDDLDSSSIRRKIKELEIQHETNKDRLKTSLHRSTQKFESQKSNTFKTRKELNKYFYYKGEYHKITDTGKGLVIRAKDDNGNWTMLSVAKILMEEYLKKPQPTPKHRVGFKDFDYRNITPINMIWETPKEKSDRFHKMFPFKAVLRDKKVRDANTSNKPEKFHDQIIKLLAGGNNYKQTARKLEIPYYTLYRYCKKQGL